MVEQKIGHALSSYQNILCTYDGITPFKHYVDLALLPAPEFDGIRPFCTSVARSSLRRALRASIAPERIPIRRACSRLPWKDFRASSTFPSILEGRCIAVSNYAKQRH